VKQYGLTQKIDIKQQETSVDEEEQSFDVNQSLQQTQKMKSYPQDTTFQGLSKTLSKEALVHKLKKANIKGLGKKLIVLNKDREADNSMMSKPKPKIKLAPGIISQEKVQKFKII
jgi:hypothetical protein